MSKEKCIQCVRVARCHDGSVTWWESEGRRIAKCNCMCHVDTNTEVTEVEDVDHAIRILEGKIPWPSRELVQSAIKTVTSEVKRLRDILTNL